MNDKSEHEIKDAIICPYAEKCKVNICQHKNPHSKREYSCDAVCEFHPAHNTKCIPVELEKKEEKHGECCQEVGFFGEGTDTDSGTLLYHSKFKTGKAVGQGGEEIDEVFEALSSLADLYKNYPNISDEDRYGEIYRIEQAIKQQLESFYRKEICGEIEKELSDKEIGVTENLTRNQFDAIKCSDIDKAIQTVRKKGEE